MGLELLDFGLQVEREHRLRLDGRKLEDFGITRAGAQAGRKWDIRVEDLRTYLNTEAALVCACGYLLRGLPGAGMCPACGKEYQRPALSHEALAKMLFAVLGVREREITAELWLEKDLSML